MGTSPPEGSQIKFEVLLLSLFFDLYSDSMPKRSSKELKDLDKVTFDVVRPLAPDWSVRKEERQKNPAAVELGRLGGLKGGKARAAKLSAKKRIAIAKKAAWVRWNGNTGGSDNG